MAIELRIQEKTGMTDQTLDEVDWDSHTMAVGQSQLSQPFLLKLLHQILPIGTLIHKHDLVSYTIDCPTCHQREKGLTNLDWWAQKNDLCDTTAKAFGHRCRTQRQVPRDKLFGETVTGVHIAGEKLTHTSVEELYTRTFGNGHLCTGDFADNIPRLPRSMFSGTLLQKQAKLFPWAFVNGMPSIYLVTSPRRKSF
jgi:hypothetical protein